MAFKKMIHQRARNTSVVSAKDASTAEPSKPRERKQPAPADTLCVVVRNSSIVLLIPKEDVFYAPANQKRQVLCEQFDPADPHGSCRHGCECRWVHADTSRATEKFIHVAYAWRSREEVAYPLMEAGTPQVIEQPTATREDVPAETVDSGMIIRTRCVFDDPKRPASHCAHFYYHRECHLGALCDFAHVAYVDANSEPGQRAPPVVNGRRKRGYSESKGTWSMRDEERGSGSFGAGQSPQTTPQNVCLPVPCKGRRGMRSYRSAQNTPWTSSFALDEAPHLVSTRRLQSNYTPTNASFTPPYSYLEAGSSPYDYCEPSHVIDQPAPATPPTPPTPCRKVEINSADGVSRWRYDPYGISA